MERFTICGLRSFVDYVNETVPKIEGKHFEIQSTNGCHFIILKGDGGKYGTAAQDTHSIGGTPRDCVHHFALWLSGTTCPRDAYDKIASYIVRHSI